MGGRELAGFNYFPGPNPLGLLPTQPNPTVTLITTINAVPGAGRQEEKLGCYWRLCLSSLANHHA